MFRKLEIELKECLEKNHFKMAIFTDECCDHLKSLIIYPSECSFSPVFLELSNCDKNWIIYVGDIHRVIQHRNAELTEKYSDKCVSTAWITGFLEHNSELALKFNQEKIAKERALKEKIERERQDKLKKERLLRLKNKKIIQENIAKGLHLKKPPRSPYAQVNMEKMERNFDIGPIFIGEGCTCGSATPHAYCCGLKNYVK